MAKVYKAPTNKAGEEVSLKPQSGNDGNLFNLIPQGWYTAIVTSVADEVTAPNKNGKSFLKITPEFTILDKEGRTQTIINRQQFTMGYYDPKTKELYHPDGTFPIWGGQQGARFFLSALGLFLEVDGGYRLTFELENGGYALDLIKDRGVKVRSGIAGYVKGNTPLSNEINTAEGFNKMAVEAISEISRGAVVVWGMEDIPEIVRWFNRKHGLGDADGNTTQESGMKTKNTIVACYPVDAWVIDERAWYKDENGSVYTTEAGYNWYVASMAERENSEENGSW